MTFSEEQKPSLWIKSPTVDLFFFSFGWVLIFFAYLWVDQTKLSSDGRWWILNFVLLTTLFHRHLTFPLVYGDPETLRDRKKTYLFLPIILLVLTVGSVLYVREPSFTTSPLSQPLEFKSGESFYVFLRMEDKGRNIKIKLSALETSATALASKIQREAGDYLHVQAVDDKLKFSAVPGVIIKRFSFGAFRGSGLRERLGLPKIASMGWRQERPVFLFLLILSSLWNFYHTLMQKMGILRVYSRKSGHGRPWLDKAMVFVWFGWLFFTLAGSEVARTQASRLATTGKFLSDTLEPIFHLLPWIANAFMILAVALTLWYFIEEWRKPEKIHWPKNLFLLSLWGIYLTFFYDFLVGFVVFGFAHAIEYLAFVNIYSKKKYGTRPVETSLMARWIRHQGRNFLLFVGISSLIFIPWYLGARNTLNYYIVGTSFLHFLYDGWIWKMRNPKVGQPLGISYPAATPRYG